jgi:hypothetical protein
VLHLPLTGLLNQLLMLRQTERLTPVLPLPLDMIQVLGSIEGHPESRIQQRATGIQMEENGGFTQPILGTNLIGTSTRGRLGIHLGRMCLWRVEMDRGEEDRMIGGGFTANGAFGPLIYVIIKSDTGAKFMNQLFLDLASRPIGSAFDITKVTGVEIADLPQLNLRRTVEPRDKHLEVGAAEPNSFEWTCTREEWIQNAGLMEPFLEGKAGHQYMTSDVIDDALVEISFGEAISSNVTG